MKKKVVYSTSFWVSAYGVFYLLLTLLYCLPRILAQFSNIDVSNINENFTFPLEIFAWGLLAISAGYCGFDRGILAKKSSMMEIGTCDVGNPAKLRKVIYLLSLVFAENLLLNFYLSSPFASGDKIFPGINLPLDGVASALVSSIVIFVTGTKAIRLTQNFDTTSENQEWANEKEEKVIIEEK